MVSVDQSGEFKAYWSDKGKDGYLTRIANRVIAVVFRELVAATAAGPGWSGGYGPADRHVLR